MFSTRFEVGAMVAGFCQDCCTACTSVGKNGIANGWDSSECTTSKIGSGARCTWWWVSRPNDCAILWICSEKWPKPSEGEVAPWDSTLPSGEATDGGTEEKDAVSEW